MINYVKVNQERSKKKFSKLGTNGAKQLKIIARHAMSTGCFSGF